MTAVGSEVFTSLWSCPSCIVILCRYCASFCAETNLRSVEFGGRV